MKRKKNPVKNENKATILFLLNKEKSSTSDALRLSIWLVGLQDTGILYFILFLNYCLNFTLLMLVCDRNKDLIDWDPI